MIRVQRTHSTYWTHSVVFAHEVETMESLPKKTANDEKVNTEHTERKKRANFVCDFLFGWIRWRGSRARSNRRVRIVEVF